MSLSGRSSSSAPSDRLPDVSPARSGAPVGKMSSAQASPPRGCERLARARYCATARACKAATNWEASSSVSVGARETRRPLRLVSRRNASAGRAWSGGSSKPRDVSGDMHSGFATSTQPSAASPLGAASAARTEAGDDGADEGKKSGVPSGGRMREKTTR
ncbi:leucine rich repeat-containing protein [Toxoplasma gondii VAND]|uniref:Leucine rich repeat-containing protein n=1 Tax=Toxoplasma gondii VAND TaxID=933077 RepID=A0A086PI95_TOXGO|nr:leucine rich repeat-containing protein [Toxoplasma gondii VAND]